MKQELGYTCPQTKKQCDDECCVSAEDCHAKAINNIISNCEPEQLNQNKMEIEWVEIECDFCHGEGYDEDSLTTKDEVNTSNHCANCDGSGVIFELTIKSE